MHGLVIIIGVFVLLLFMMIKAMKNRASGDAHDSGNHYVDLHQGLHPVESEADATPPSAESDTSTTVTVPLPRPPERGRGEPLVPIFSLFLSNVVGLSLIIASFVFRNDVGTWALVLSCMLYPVFVLVLPSLYYIPALYFAMVQRLFSFVPGKNKTVNVVAMDGEAGYDYKLLYTGLNLRWWFLYRLTLWRYSSVPQDELALVIFQTGAERPTGNKTAEANIREDDTEQSELPTLRDVIADPKLYRNNGGQSGASRYILKPGDPFVYHPAGCLIVLKDQVLGIPISAETRDLIKPDGKPDLSRLSLKINDFQITKIEQGPGKEYGGDGKEEDKPQVDTCGVVTILDGPQPPSGTIASRMGGWDDLNKLTNEEDRRDKVLSGSEEFRKTNGYQKLKAFFWDKNMTGGNQVDTLVEGNYLLNPLVVRVRRVPMLNVREGWVAVIISHVGLEEKDTAHTFGHGTIVEWGHKGIAKLPLRPRKYALNPTCFTPVLFRTALTTLELIDGEGTPFDHKLDTKYSGIFLTTRDGFQPKVGVIIQFYISDTEAPEAAQRFSSMAGLVDQGVVPTVLTQLGVAAKEKNLGEFIENTQGIIDAATGESKKQLKEYGVTLEKIAFAPTIENLPEEFEVLRTGQTLAIENEKKFGLDARAQTTRLNYEKALGAADIEHDVNFSKGMIDVQSNWGKAIEALTPALAAYRSKVGDNAGDELGVQLGTALAMHQQKTSIGETATAVLNVVKKLADAGIKVVPDQLVLAGDSQGILSALTGQLSAMFQKTTATTPAPAAQPAP